MYLHSMNAYIYEYDAYMHECRHVDESERLCSCQCLSCVTFLTRLLRYTLRAVISTYLNTCFQSYGRHAKPKHSEQSSRDHHQYETIRVYSEEKGNKCSLLYDVLIEWGALIHHSNSNKMRGIALMIFLIIASSSS